MKKNINKKTGILLVSLFVMIAGYAWCASSDSQPSLPTLAAGLPESVDEAKKTFEQRVVDKFPLGSSELQMADELLNEGFEIKVRDDQTHIAAFEEAKAPCKQHWVISWKAVNDKIVSVNGEYSFDCP